MACRPLMPCVAALGLVAWSLAVGIPPTSAFGQTASNTFYVARVVGEWEVAGTGRPLRALDRISASARLRLIDRSRVRDTDILVLRDPRTLRTATWRCTSPARCHGERTVQELQFDGNALPRTQRTGALFVHLGENEELRGRVELVGARSEERDWGLVVLVVEGGFVRLAPIARHAAEGARLVARLCSLTDAPTEARAECLTSRDLWESDCALSDPARCAWGGAASPQAVRIDVYVRERTMLSSLAYATALGVVVPISTEREAAALAATYARDLEGLRPHVSTEEFVALRGAAVLEIARSLQGAVR